MLVTRDREQYTVCCINEQNNRGPCLKKGSPSGVEEESVSPLSQFIKGNDRYDPSKNTSQLTTRKFLGFFFYKAGFSSYFVRTSLLSISSGSVKATHTALSKDLFHLHMPAACLIWLFG